jgi:hypothetical protein
MGVHITVWASFTEFENSGEISSGAIDGKPFFCFVCQITSKVSYQEQMLPNVLTACALMQMSASTCFYTVLQFLHVILRGAHAILFAKQLLKFDMYF